MTDFLLSELQRLVQEFRAKKPVPCGIVFRSASKEAIKGKLLSSDSESKLPIFSLPVFFDTEQQEDCIVFEDRETLYAYLNRRENPKAWAEILVKALPKSSVDPFEPRIPLPDPPRYTNPWMGF